MVRFFRNPQSIHEKLLNVEEFQTPLVADDIGYRIKLISSWDYLIAAVGKRENENYTGSRLIQYFDSLPEKTELPETYLLLHSQLRYRAARFSDRHPFYLQVTGFSGSMQTQDMSLDIKVRGPINENTKRGIIANLGTLQLTEKSRLLNSKAINIPEMVHPIQLLNRGYKKPEYK